MLRKIDKRLAQIEELKNDIIGMLPDGNAFLEQIKSNAIAFGSLHARSLKELRVAAIMDRFTLECFEPECDLVELTPDNWQQEVDAFNPELLFVESAWEGKNGSWHRKIAHCSDELYELTEYCHKRKIPVVFWNKEDPVYTDTFIPAARCADVVFTTDIDCIEKYKTELGHDRVYHLHFAAQPRVHNPIEKYKRKDKFCFAGAYYHRYQERCKVFDAFSDYFTDSKGLDIYDRNYMNARPEHKFPERYDPYILGRLDSSEIDVAYKGYIFGINMNSVQQSQTMFARRVFELMASNTVVVGNYSRGVKNYFGDLTICTDDAKTLKNAIEKYCVDSETVDKYRLLSLRKVLKEHLCEDRLDFIVQKVYGRSLKPTLPMVAVCAHVKNQAEAKRVCNLFDRQTYGRKQLIIVSSFPVDVPESVTLFSDEEFAEKRIKDCVEAEYVAYFDAKDWYGENYLLDLALTLRYGTFSGIGKNEYYYCAQSQKVSRTGHGEAYHLTNNLIARRSIVELSKIPDIYGKELYGDTEWNLDNMISVDAQNYCANWTENECIDAADMTIPDQGIPMKQIESAAEAVSANYWNFNSVVVDAKQIAATKIDTKTPVEIILSGNTAVLSSNLPEGVHTYLYVSSMIDISPLLEDGRLSVVFQGTGSLDLICACIFYDASGKKLDVQYPKLGRREILTPPKNGTRVKLAYRPKGAGKAILHKIELGGSLAAILSGKRFLSRSNVLVLTNHYPAPDDLYRNMFVHKRVTAYKDDGYVFDVMKMHPYAKDSFREFEGINVIEGHEDSLATVLSNGLIDTVCIHFLDRDMWNILKDHLGSVRLIVWIHGAEIQPWWRREYNFESAEELNFAKKQSEDRMNLWREVFSSSIGHPIQFVFVSQYFASEVFEDYQIHLPSDKYYVIHNCIDTDQFNYIPKTIEARKKVLSIRPYASNKYANDLSVKAIFELAKESWFSELEFLLVGNGVLFEKLLQPLAKFSNVQIRKTFLTQGEIADLHKQYGIFLTPTRMDAQGVSRDEAMSSGLVPVTNAVTAIPEFVDDTCGILAPGEDYIAMAEGIKKLYENPNLFLQMSRNAADRVRHQSSKEYTIDKEISLIID